MKKLLITAAAVSLAWPAYAADLGGNCCADLEERVAELEATTARKGNRKVRLKVSGHINEAILWADGADPAFINNPNSSGRFRFKGSAKINQDWSAGFLMEFGIHHNAPADHGVGAALASQSLDPLDPGHQVSIRHQALYIKSKSVGTIWLGHTSTATDSIVEMDLSNGSIATTLANPSVLGGGIMDGGRAGLVRYISPDLGGFNLSGSWQSDDVYDVAMRFAGEFGSIRVAAGVGYAKDEERERASGSASVKHMTSGLFASAMYGRANNGFEVDLFDLELDSDATQYGFRVGLDRKLNAHGTTTVYGEWSEIDIKGEGKLTYWGGAIVQSIDPAAMDVYLAYRKIEPDGDDSADEIIAGARIKF